ncbi:MAG: AAA family ATPase [Anaerolineae bacterium]|jgi:predicted ATPase|nr:AAA family ATPase [Anaerolineae bacterium]
MARLKRLKVENYKSLRDVDLKLRPLNILIGKNGSGKSNLMGLMRLLANAVRDPKGLSDTINYEGGFRAIIWRGGQDKNESITIQLEFDQITSVPNTDKLYYEIQIAPQAKNNAYYISKEELSRDPYEGHSNRYIFLGAYDGQLKILNLGKGQDQNEAELEDYSDQALMIGQLRTSRYRVINEIREAIGDWVSFRGFGEDALQNIYAAQSLTMDAQRPLRLKTDGSNLIAVLSALKENGDYADAYEQLTEALSAAFGDFKALQLPSRSYGNAELEWRFQNNWQFPAGLLSDGTLRFLGLAVLLNLPDPPALIALDEPEIGLHPEMLPLLAEMLKATSRRSTVFVATHSPELLSAEAIESGDVVTVEKEAYETRLERPQAERLRLWLERYTLGNLWMMGKLG